MHDAPSLYESFSMAMNYYKTLRRKNNKEIADALNLPTSTISSWNTGKHLPDMGRLQRLANYLDAPIELFFNFSRDKLPDKELIDLHNKIDTDEDLLKFFKLFLNLSNENKHLLTTIALKLKN